LDGRSIDRVDIALGRRRRRVQSDRHGRPLWTPDLSRGHRGSVHRQLARDPASRSDRRGDQGTRAHGRRPECEGLSRSYLFRAVDASLLRLRTDYIDLYQVHWSDPLTPLEETLGALDDLRRAGKIRYIGCSNFPAWMLCKALWLSDKH